MLGNGEFPALIQRGETTRWRRSEHQLCVIVDKSNPLCDGEGSLIHLGGQFSISHAFMASRSLLKVRGTVLGANGKALAIQRKAEAVERLAPIADRLRSVKDEGLSLRRAAEMLNAEGVLTPAGKPWHAANLARALERVL